MLCRLCLLLMTCVALVACAGDTEPAAVASAQRAYLEAQLSELAALPKPDGVTLRDWDGLKLALRSAISARLADAGSGKAASAAPGSDSDKPALRFDLDSNTFYWRLVNPGDYDQNGEVNISDLTPLAVHLGQAVGTQLGAENSALAQIDGDGNGLITIADITPLGANLGNRITGYELNYAQSLSAYPETNSGPDGVPATTTLPFSSAIGDRTVERLLFELPSTALNDNGAYWVRAVDAATATEGSPSQPITATLLPPTISLSADPLVGAPPLTVTLDASANFALSFEFDPEGDGTFVPTGDNPALLHIYETAGAYNATVRGEASSGHRVSSTVAVNVGAAPAWHRYTLPKAEAEEEPRAIGVGSFDGLPYVLLTYFIPSSGNSIAYAQQALTTAGNSWGEPKSFFTSLGDNTHIQTHLLQGDPAALMLRDSGAASFRRVTTWPQQWELSVPFNSGSGAQQWYSWRYFLGRPSAAYYDHGADGLRFTVGVDTLGSSWTSPIAPVTGSGLGQGASLAEVNGGPGIAFYSEGNGMFYVDGTGGNPPAAWNPPVLISAGVMRFYDSLITLQDGTPGVVYNGSLSNSVRFRRATDASGDVWPASSVFKIADTDGNSEIEPRAIMAGNRVQAFWRDPATTALWHAAATSADGMSWGAPVQVAGSSDPNVRFAPAEVNGIPALGYAASNGNFRFAIFY